MKSITKLNYFLYENSLNDNVNVFFKYKEDDIIIEEYIDISKDDIQPEYEAVFELMKPVIEIDMNKVISLLYQNDSIVPVGINKRLIIKVAIDGDLQNTSNDNIQNKIINLVPSDDPNFNLFLLKIEELGAKIFQTITIIIN